MLFLLPWVIVGCRPDNASQNQLYFSLINSGKTNIHFNNKITESDSVNVFINEYMYNGSGVGIGDFNNDGLADIFFAGSMVSSKLYINKGNFEFEDITKGSGLETNTWCTGISVVDINNDGFQDIYVCTSHSTDPEKRKNKLFINDGFSPSPNGQGRGEVHFTDQAAAYGLADTGYATQAGFFDFDNDDDLDMYLLNHRLYSHTANNLQPKDTSGNSPAQDRLYRNDGIKAGKSHPVFRDVTIEAGIREDGYGLGLVITDVNNDSRPDIYVANDYIANDLLWFNNGDGSFVNIIGTSLGHQSYNSMGVDAADINNDLLPDIASLDMLPETNQRKKMMLNATNQEKFDMQQRFGYQPSYMRNMLHINNGNRKIDNRNEPFYSEIGQMAGVFETDWSWSILMADFDNDGWKDIHVTNGLGKDVTNNDYATFRNEQAHLNSYTFGGTGIAKNALDGNTISLLRKEIDAYGSVRMDNYLFRNNGDLTFSNVSKQAGLAMSSISCGAAYADLDNDGDLDLVVNNINEDAFILRNETRQMVSDTTHNFLSIFLKGSAGNYNGLGSRITLFSKEGRQYIEQSPVRGFSSSVDQRIHFGVGKTRVIDSIKIQWPDNKSQVITNVKANKALVINYTEAEHKGFTNDNMILPALFSDITGEAGLVFKHAEVQNFDFAYSQPLLQRYSQLGGCIATGDINGDGLTDFFAGGAANQPGKAFIQKNNGDFVSKSIVDGVKVEEDLGSVLFDADGDNDLDLVVTGGSLEFGVATYNQPRLFINDGKGIFTLSADALPAITDITKAVAVADYDDDGDLDIFMGGRLLPKKYPQSPRSYILQNNAGKFTDITKTVCPAIEFPGMIDAAVFTDFNNDNKPDLVIAGEWTTIRFFKNINNKLVEVTDATGLQDMRGLWRSLQQADIDKDGDMDYIAGNMGLNNKYHLAAGRPVMMYVKDIDKNGFEELIPAWYIKNRSGQYELYPELDRNQLAAQIPAVKKKYLLHQDYSRVTMQQLLNDFDTEGWTTLKAETFSSVWIENIGAGKFHAHVLPTQAQIAPVNSIIADDFDGDGNTDIVVAGNEYQANSNTGRYDASYGLLLKGDGNGNFTPVNMNASGLIINGDVKDMKMVSIRNKGKILLVAPNDSPLKTFILTYHP
jgi:hypothetical protein